MVCGSKFRRDSGLDGWAVSLIFCSGGDAMLQECPSVCLLGGRGGGWGKPGAYNTKRTLLFMRILSLRLC